MIRISEIAFSCYAVTDMARSRSFYEGVLGLKPTTLVGEPGGMQWTEYDLGSGTLALGVAPGWNPSAEGAVVALEVDNFEEAMTHLKANNVRFKIEPFPTPVCQMAFIFDPDNNTVCLHKRHAGH